MNKLLASLVVLLTLSVSTKGHTSDTYAGFEGTTLSPLVSDSSCSHSFRTWSGTTPSSSTGPSGAAKGTGRYAYMETSSGSAYSAGNTACMSLSNVTNPRLTFYYHMYGSNIGTLNVEYFNSGVWQTIWTKTGQQQTSSASSWLRADINLSSYVSTGPKNFRIKAIAAGSWQGDIAVDEVLLHQGSEYIYETFESGLSWKNTGAYDWLRRTGGTTSSGTGPSGAHYGSYYGYLETSSGHAYNSGDTAYLESPILSNTSNMSFSWHMYGSDIGSLYLQQKIGGTWSTVWSRVNQYQTSNSAAWQRETVSLNSDAKQVRFKAVAKGGYRGDIAIDQMTFGVSSYSSEVYWPSEIDPSSQSQIEIEAGDYHGVASVYYSFDGVNFFRAVEQNGKFIIDLTNAPQDGFTLHVNVVDTLGNSTSSSKNIEQNATGYVDVTSELAGKHEHVGVTSGAFRVSESGAATYSVPISTPKGTAGVKPQISLDYNSQGGDGHLGRGWSIGGQSAISRCPKTIAHDGVIGGVTGTNTDRLCYNGQRLVTTSAQSSDSAYWTQGTKYTTDIASYATFTNLGNTIVMETKSGEAHFFGDVNSVSSFTSSEGIQFKSTTAFHDEIGSTNTSDGRPNSFTWLLKVVVDVKGNYFSYNYDDNEKEPFLDSISYTGNYKQNLVPYASIEFGYGNNPKPAKGYRFGEEFELTRLLENVTVKVDNEVFRYYELGYDRAVYAEELNYLESIVECVNTSKTNCNAPLTFEWLKPAEIYTSIIPSCEIETGIQEVCVPDAVADPYKAFHDSAMTVNAELNNLHVFDMTGDGYSDFVWEKNNAWYLKKSGVGVTEELASNFISLPEYALNIDYDGDGTRDLLVSTGNGTYWNVIRSKKRDVQISISECMKLYPLQPNSACYNGDLVTQTNVEPLNIKGPRSEGDTIVADVNGDGLEDLIELYSNRVEYRLNTTSGLSSSTATALSLPSNQTIISGAKATSPKHQSSASIDFNGDGITDIGLKIQSANYICEGYNFEIGELETIPGVTSQAQCESIEQDNTNDYTFTDWKATSSSTVWRFYEGQVVNGNPSYSSTPFYTLSQSGELRFPDFNGDGLIDLMYKTSGSWKYRLSDGNGFKTEQTTALNPDSNLKHLFQVVDINADGRSDIMYGKYIGSNVSWVQYISQPVMNNAEKVHFTERGAYPLESNSAVVRFAELNGDAHLDLLQYSSSNWHLHFGISKGQPRHAIDKIINGFGVTTTINYDSIMKENVYPNSASPYLDHTEHSNESNTLLEHQLFSPKGGMYVVQSVSSDVSSTESVEVEYEYQGLTINKVGRGSLGFYSLTTRDMSTCDVSSETVYTYGPYGYPNGTEQVTKKTNCIETETRYSQAFPHVGKPVETIKSRGNIVISQASNDYESRVLSSGATASNLVKSTEVNFDLDTNYQKTTLLNATETTMTYDNDGNVDISVTLVGDSETPINSSNRLKTLVDNDYLNSRYGRLSKTTTTKTLTKNGGDEPSQIRVADFQYNPASHASPYMLSSESIQSESKYISGQSLGNQSVPGFTSNSATYTKLYQYDVWGNISEERVQSPDFAADRVTLTNYFDRGRYVKSTSTEAGGISLDKIFKYNGSSSTRVSGVIDEVKTTSTNDSYTISMLDAWGTAIEAQSYSLSGTSRSNGVDSTMYTAYCASSGITCPADAMYVANEFQPGAGEKLTYFDSWGREIRTSVLTMSGWSHTDSFYNELGLPFRITEPYFSGGTVYSTETLYDKLKRVSIVHLAGGGSQSYHYDGLETSVTNAKSQTKVTTKDYRGLTSSVVDAHMESLNYDYDAASNLTEVKVSGLTQIRNFYDVSGKKVLTVDNDKGIWKYEYNSFGELIHQSSANALNGNANLFANMFGKSQSLFYDALGRKTRRLEKEGTTCWYYGNNELQSNKGRLIDVRYYTAQMGACPSITDTGYEYAEALQYNEHGAVKSKSIVFEGQTHTTSHQFDSFQRLKTTVYPGDNVSVNYQYVNGAVEKLIDGSSLDVLKLVSSVNARGQAMNVTYSNGVSEQRLFEEDTGLADRFDVMGSNWDNFQDYGFDNIGNLTSRSYDIQYVNNSGLNNFNLTESLDYDQVNRVESRLLSGIGGFLANYTVGECFNYDQFGNIRNKYTVSASSNCQATPPSTGTYNYISGQSHNRLTSVNGLHTSIGYDFNGNINSDDTRNYTYTSYDLPSLIASKVDSNRTERFEYGPNRNLVKKISKLSSSQTNTTYYFGNYEQVNLASGLQERKYYVGNIIITRRSSGVSDTYFLHQDHLGSTSSISDDSGNLVATYLYDTFGQQHNLMVSDQVSLPYSQAVDRGYTGHKEIADLNIIHMNGRTYDPTLGRFLQADPHVQAPSNMQNYNRYSYVLNNPMSMTDPSGYFFKKLGSFVKKYWRVAAMAAISYYTGQWAQGLEMFAGNAIAAGAAAGGLTGFVTGAVATGSLKGALSGAVTGAIFGAVGGHFKSMSLGAQMTAHGMAGGILSVLQGGKFGHGFVRAGLSKWAGKGSAALADAGRGVMATIVQAIAGGTISRLTGGKFANGAVTSAIQFTVNELTSRFSSSQHHEDTTEPERTSEALKAALKVVYDRHQSAGINDCGDYVVDVAKSMGVDSIADLGYAANADGIIAEAASSGTSYTIDDAAKIQELVSQGEVVIMGVTSTGANKAHGHVAIVRPDSWGSSGSWGGKVPIIAHRVLGGTPNLSIGSNYAFSSRYKSNVKFYHVK